MKKESLFTLVNSSDFGSVLFSWMVLMYGKEDVPKDVLECTEFESCVGMTYGMTSWNDI